MGQCLYLDEAHPERWDPDRAALLATTLRAVVEALVEAAT
jgi:hypothetical protein